MIRTRALTKSFGPILAVDGIDLDVHEGDIYGFLGANGSGKTTTVRMLLGLVLPTSGEVTVLGRKMPGSGRDVLPHVGALVEGPAAYPQLSGRVNLAVLDAAGSDRRSLRRTRRRRIEDALDRVGLGGVDARPVRAYSLGMRQRLGLAAAILRSPRLLVLDEPTNGLDPQGIGEIRTLIRELHAAGTTVLLLSHQLVEVEQLSTRIGVLDRGRLVLQDDLTALCGPTGRIHLRTPDVARARALLDGNVEGITPDGLLVREADPAALNALLVRDGVRVEELTTERRTLEEAVLAATGSGADRIDRT